LALFLLKIKAIIQSDYILLTSFYLYC